MTEHYHGEPWQPGFAPGQKVRVPARGRGGIVQDVFHQYVVGDQATRVLHQVVLDDGRILLAGGDELEAAEAGGTR